VDGQPFGKIYADIENRPVFSPDGKHIAFGALTALEIGEKAEGVGIIVMDSKELEPRYESVRTIAFSPDSKRLAYEARRKSKFIVVLDGQESKEYKLVWPRSLVLSHDSHRLAYRVSTDHGEYVVVDGSNSRHLNSSRATPSAM